MKWSIEQLKRLKAQGLTIDETVDVSELKDRDSQIREISKVKVKGEADFYSGAVSFRLHISGDMVLPCSNTLADVKYPFDIKAVETFQMEPSSSEWEMEDDEEIHQVEGNTVDLLPYIMENILLEIPMRVISPDAELKQSGTDWAIVSEKDKKEQIDPRLAELAKFFDQKSE